jgi:predicted amidohydrolase YtcJ
VTAATSGVLLDDATVWAGPRCEPKRTPLAIVGDRFASVDDRVAIWDGLRVGLAGGHVVPGFVDAHSHLSVAAWIPWFADGARWGSAAQAIAEIRNAASGGGTSWILAFNVQDDDWRDGRPTPEQLEEAAPGRPVMLVHLSLHRAILSETALRRLAICRATRDPAGDIERGRRGRLTGMVWESVFGRALTTALRETAEGIEPAMLDSLLDAEAERHLAVGITSCHDPCVPAAFVPAMTSLSGRSALRLSWSHVSPTGILEPPDAPAALQPTGDGPRSAKLFLDGAHRCALCLDPRDVMAMAVSAASCVLARGDTRPLRELMRYRIVYRHPHFHMPYLRFGDADLASRISAFARHGIRLRIHALGNAAVAQACRVLETESVRDAAIEHLVVLTDREVEAVAASGAVASLQPGFISHYGPSLLDRALPERWLVIPTATLLRAGVPVALSSDYPCGPLDPLFNMRQAVERCLGDGRAVGPAEAVGRPEALVAYTIGGSRAIHGESSATHGSLRGIEPGATADFVVLSGDPYLRDTRVLRTWIGGREVWRAPDQPSIGA